MDGNLDLLHIASQLFSIQNHQPSDYRLLFPECCKKVFFWLLFCYDVHCLIRLRFEFYLKIEESYSDISGLFVQSFLGAVLCCILFGAGMGYVVDLARDL